MSSRISIARPYAKAVFEFALEVGDLDLWSHFLETVASAVENPQMSVLIKNPEIQKTMKINVFREICQSMMNPYRENFLFILGKNNRLELLPDIWNIFQSLLADHKKVVRVSVRTAQKISKTVEKKLVKALEHRLQKNIELIKEMDASLKGGVLIQMGDKVLDGSVKSRLRQLEKELIGS